MKNKNIKEILFYFGLILIMIMSLNLAVRDCTGIDMSFTRMFTITLIATAAASIAILYPIMILAGLMTGIGWLLFYYYKDPEAIKLYIQEASEFFSWLYGYIAGYNYFEQGYSMVFPILYAALAALIISLIVYSGRGSFPIIILGTAVLSFFWFVYVEKARQYLALFLFGSVMLYSYQVYKNRLKKWRTEDSIIEQNIGHNWMLCTAAAVSISLALSLALPLNISPVRWTWLNYKVVSLFPFISEWRNDALESFSYGYNSRYSLNFAGSKGNKLGGEVRLDDSVVMTVKTRGEDTLYLRGVVKDEYFENSWRESGKGYKEYDPNDTMPLPFGDSINTYEKTLEITYKKLITSTIFAPYSIRRVQHNIKKIYADDDSEAYASKMIMKDEPYTIKSIMPYIDVMKLRGAKAEGLKPGDFNRYTALFGDIPARVRFLAREITNAQGNNYDKAKAVEKYLRQNYKYTLKPPELPSKAEFTDHFLFSGKEGYCTYFATSMSVLLRAAGIPCRYVEGFISRYDGDYEREVRGTNAHAWVEVYFDDYGWVTFEPTPQYPEVEILKPQDETGEINTDIVRDTRIRDRDMGSISSGRLRQLEDKEMVGRGTISEDGKKQFNIGRILLLVISSLLAMRVVFMYLMRVIKEIRLGRSKGRKFAADFIKDMVWYMKRAGFTMKKEETLREFLKRIRYDCEEEISDIPIIIPILEKTRYGGCELSTEERRILEIFKKNVKNFALKKAGAIKFFINSYILGDRADQMHKIHVEIKNIT